MRGYIVGVCTYVVKGPRTVVVQARARFVSREQLDRAQLRETAQETVLRPVSTVDHARSLVHNVSLLTSSDSTLPQNVPTRMDVEGLRRQSGLTHAVDDHSLESLKLGGASMVKSGDNPPSICPKTPLHISKFTPPHSKLHISTSTTPIDSKFLPTSLI